MEVLRKMVQEYLIGELGIIEKIDEVEKQMKIKFDDDKIVWYQFSELEQTKDYI